MDNTKVIFDHDMEGNIDPDGSIRQYWEKDALTQSLKMWIASYKGECLRSPNRGGYISRWLLKPMNDSTIDLIKMAIRDGIAQDFDPPLEILELTVEPNYTNRYWRIYLKVDCKYLKLQVEVDERIRARVT
jgi:hypothetical protein